MIAVELRANSTVVCIVTLCFEHAQQLDCVIMLSSNEPIKVAHLQKLAKQSVLNSALVIEK